jgi:hypothetical protein
MGMSGGCSWCTGHGSGTTQRESGKEFFRFFEAARLVRAMFSAWSSVNNFFHLFACLLFIASTF